MLILLCYIGLSSNSITAICCGFAVERVMKKVHNKSERVEFEP